MFHVSVEHQMITVHNKVKTLHAVLPTMGVPTGSILVVKQRIVGRLGRPITTKNQSMVWPVSHVGHTNWSAVGGYTHCS